MAELAFAEKRFKFVGNFIKTIKRWRRDAPSIFPSKMRERIWRSIVHQDQLARRYGLTILTVTFTLLMLAVLITLSYLSVLALVDSGALSRPETP